MSELNPLRHYLSRRRTRSLISNLSNRLNREIKIAVLDHSGQVWLGPAGLGMPEPEASDGLEPIVAEKQIVGWLCIRGGTASDRTLITASLGAALSALAELGIETRSLAEETLNRYREINFLYAAGESLRTGFAEEEIADSLLTELLEVLRVDDGLILLPREESGHIVAQRGELITGLDSDVVEALLAVNDAVQFPAGFGSSLSSEAIVDPYASGLCVPLKYDGRSEGVIVVGAKRDQSIYTAGDEKLLGALGEQLALFLQVARLYADLQERNQELQSAMTALREAQDELLQSERMSALGSVASRVVHDVKGPLGVLKGYAGLISHPDLVPGQADEFAHRMMTSVDDVVAMLEEILDFARGRSDDLERELTEIKPYFEDVADALRVRAGDLPIEIEVRVADPELSYALDPHKFRRVLYNLAGNAIDAVSRSGGAIRLAAARVNNHLAVAVSDDGPGIPAEIRQNLFEPFVTKGKRNGTGLGLAITKKIVEGHGGTISVGESSEGGAAFSIELPWLDYASLE
jgi:signal transduction histidine kinase